MSRKISKSDLDEVFDMMADGGLDPTPLPYTIDVQGLFDYARKQGKEPSKLVLKNIIESADKEYEGLMAAYSFYFGELPPLPYSLDYDDKVVVEVMRKALETGVAITLDTYPSDVQERVITGIDD